MMPKVVPGGLPAEYLAVEYLESTGTQWIKTDIESRFAMTFEMEQAYTSSAGDTYGAGFEDNGFSICAGGNYLNHYQWKYQGSYRDLASGIPSVNVKYKFRSELKPGNQNIYRDDVLIEHDNIVQTSTTLTGKHLGLFCRLVNDTTANLFAKIKLYSLKVYDGDDVLLGNLLPCIRISDSKPGMYDLVGRQFYVNQGTGEFLTGYIADGLIFKLDGIDKGNDPTKWIDTIGGKVFTLTGCTFTSNGVTIGSNTGDGGTCPGSIGTGVQNDTLEVAVTASGSNGGIANTQVVLYPECSNGSYIGLLRGSGTNGGFNANGSAYKRILINGYPTISVNDDHVVENLVERSFGNVDTWSANQTGYTTLGYRPGSNAYRLNGTIHCIRIYNRKLSVAEMVFNQTVDKQRFGLT